MSENNYSVTTEFTLVRFSDHPNLKILLFMVFSVIYLVTIVGNLRLVVLIYMEWYLRTPMYIFLGNLALMDSCCSCAATPKMLQNFFSVDRKMSLYECVVQFSFLCLAETTDSFLLAAMAYDHYYLLKSNESRGKALSTCASHFLSVSIFYGSLLFLYAQPHSVTEGDKDIPVAIFYTIVIPLLNPCIYRLRNKEVINVVKRTMEKR
ncbi:hypothetical protein U0070_014859 [Myodes glareolus]|uniref:G-protein coupled receptors family 1 profile domain-containing protein n=1 Tax=Myodes glareolus TaxID=447135 RepID=A0AAW0IDU0_MYOGA